MVQITIDDYEDIVDLALRDPRANGTEVGYFLADEWGRPSRVAVIGAATDRQANAYFDISIELFGDPNYISVSRSQSNWRDAVETAEI